MSAAADPTAQTAPESGPRAAASATEGSPRGGTPARHHPPRVRIELAKLVDTRTQRILWGTTIVLGLLVSVLAAVSESEPPDLNAMTSTLAIPSIYVLAIIAALAQTVEWGKRGTGPVTFGLDPHRGSVVLAKFVAAILAGAALGVVLVLVGLVLTPLLGGSLPSAGQILVVLGWVAAGLALTGAVGSAVGAACQIGGLAIVIFLLLAQLLPQIIASIGAIEALAPFTNILGSIGEMIGGFAPTRVDHLLGAVALWVVLPLVIGLVRARRADVG